MKRHESIDRVEIGRVEWGDRDDQLVARLYPDSGHSFEVPADPDLQEKLMWLWNKIEEHHEPPEG